MRIAGTASFAAPPAAVWAALADPALLARTIPGAYRVQALSSGGCAFAVSARAAAVSGIYEGQAVPVEAQAPTAARLHVSGVGAPGTVTAEVAVRLGPGPATAGAGTTPYGAAMTGTTLEYDADIAAEGLVAGVGQRVLAGAARQLADGFLAAVDTALGAPPAVVAAGAPAGTAGPATSTPTRSQLTAGTPARTPLTAGAVAGALGALAGWLLGRRRAGRRH